MENIPQTSVPTTSALHEFAAPRYLIEQDFGRNGRQLLGYPEMTRRNVVECIFSGEWDKLSQVLELGEPDGIAGTSGRWRDISEDIARDVLDLAIADDFGRMCEPARTFVERHLGLQEFANAVREWPAMQAAE